MKDLIRLTDLQSGEVYEIFNIADEIMAGKYNGFLNGKRNLSAGWTAHPVS